jgi:hypothetical protein
MTDIKIRYNTNCTDNHLYCRVLINGVEHLSEDVRLIGETFTECTNEYGETKWNIACYGRLVWVDKTAVIVTDKD